MLGLVEFMYLGASLVAQVDPYNGVDLHRPAILGVVAPAAGNAAAREGGNRACGCSPPGL